MARINNLTNFLTDVASAIKTKTGDSTAIPASQFDTKIADISTGNLSDEEYAEANTDLDEILEGSTPTKIYPPDWSEIGYEDTPQGIIDDFNYAKEIYDNWDKSITDIHSNFRGYPSSIFPQIDTSQVTNMNGAFYSSAILRHVPLLNTSSVERLYETFKYCSNLSNSSLNNILRMCINATSYTKAKTLQYIGLTSDQATICQGLSNYNDFIAAGWTTGY